MKVTVSFTLDDERDHKIIRWLRSLSRGERSAAIRVVLDAHLGGAGVTLGDVYQTVREIDRKLRNGAFVAGTGAEPDDTDDFERENPDIMATLINLGK